MNNGSAPDTITGGKTLELTEYDRVSLALHYLNTFVFSMWLSVLALSCAEKS